jgi:hypothetical protein
MSEHIFENQKKVDEYLNVIQDRILAPIKNTDIGNSCTAVLLLLFAAIDGLGKLIDPDDKACPSQRIRCFLVYMGGDYGVYKKELLILRHSMVHNAINVESFLSHTKMGADQHLKKMGTADFIYVNTMKMFIDFEEVFKRFRAEIQHDPIMLKRAADRLEWREDNAWSGIDTLDVPIPSLPPSVEFIYAK